MESYDWGKCNFKNLVYVLFCKEERDGVVFNVVSKVELGNTLSSQLISMYKAIIYDADGNKLDIKDVSVEPDNIENNTTLSVSGIKFLPKMHGKGFFPIGNINHSDIRKIVIERQ